MAEYIVSEQFINDIIGSFSPPSEPFEGRDEIIRCRDCKRMDEIQPETNQPCSTEPYGFCAWAERRDA